MVNTFAFNPMFLIHICAFIQTVYMVFLILLPNNFTPETKTKKGVFKIFIGLGEGSSIVFGIIFIDTAILWLFGNWSMADWRFQLPSVIVLLFLGLAYVIVPLFSRGNLLDMIFCGAAVTGVLVFLHWWIPSIAVMGPKMEVGFPIIVSVLIGAYVLVFMFKKPHQQKVETKENETEFFWDIQKELRYVFNRKVHFIFWILAVVQSMLAFYGYSILTLF